MVEVLTNLFHGFSEPEENTRGKIQLFSQQEQGCGIRYAGRYCILQC
jgi:hypothetical protein